MLSYEHYSNSQFHLFNQKHFRQAMRRYSNVAVLKQHKMIPVYQSTSRNHRWKKKQKKTRMFGAFFAFCGRLTLTWWGCYGLCLWHKPTELVRSILFCSCVYVCLYGPFNSISFHTFSRHLCICSLCSSGLISTILVLSTTYISLCLLQPKYNPKRLNWLRTPSN